MSEIAVKVFPAARSRPVVLIADDQRVSRTILAQMVRRLCPGVLVREFERPADALGYAESAPVDLVLLDLSFGEGEPTGVDLALALRAQLGERVPVVLVSAADKEELAAAAAEAGSAAWMRKPVQLAECRQIVARLLPERV